MAIEFRHNYLIMEGSVSAQLGPYLLKIFLDVWVFGLGV
jgi:hypothetical protein